MGRPSPIQTSPTAVEELLDTTDPAKVHIARASVEPLPVLQDVRLHQPPNDYS
jgi:hypothetical protein